LQAGLNKIESYEVERKKGSESLRRMRKANVEDFKTM